ncbi:hypothetical protein BKP37_12795 [Anaerobacillus alkalilacustris]|uniref:Uncharacterized protein n=1 Tax=Anaerobacillus alkalilacustris TaxID=393763 RepID=A0A1S2LK38_9BACI|nr:hypothetical protein [Anaerobacillus alkalilacustris]OIJ12674.1 hypothetical protein BKP37_12795 [Anaerobacillus alkalilacustris]
MERLVIEELTIFETVNNFNAAEAYWRDNSYCYIKGYIPKDALSPLESNFSPESKCKKKRFYYELWEHHTFAIWSYKIEKEKFEWEEAVNLLKVHRDNKMPIEMKITNDVKDWFIYTQVNEYLA